jgi:hypothetical protein
MPIPQVNERIKEAPVVVLRAVFAGIGQILLTADKVRSRAAEQVWTPDRAPVRTSAGVPAGRQAHEPPRNGTTRTEPAVADRSAVRQAPASQGPVTAPATNAARATKATPVSKATAATNAPRAAKTAPATKATPAAKPAPATKATPAAPAAKPAPATKATPAAPAAKATPAAKTPRATKTAKTVPAPRVATPEPAAEAPPLPGYDDLSLASLRARLRMLDAATIQAMLAYEKAHACREPVITMLQRRLAKISAG